MSTPPTPKKRGPAPGTGGRPKGAEKIRINLSIAQATRDWLKAHPAGPSGAVDALVVSQEAGEKNL